MDKSDIPESSNIDAQSIEGSRDIGLYGDTGTDLQVEQVEGGLKEPLLLDWRRRKEDMRLLARAAKHRWPIPDAAKRDAANRLRGIINKKSVTMVTKHGELVEAELPADINAVAAAKVLVEMEGQNQKDDHAKEGIGGTVFNQQINFGNDALEAKAAQYGLTESRLKRLVEQRAEQAGNGDTDG